MNNEQAALAADPAKFRAALLIDTDVGPRPLAECLDPWQAADFAALDGGWRRVAGLPNDGGYQRAYLERPRGHSKTADLAVMVLWVLLAATDRRLSGVAAAGDKDQSRLLRDAIAKLVALNPWLNELFDVQAYRVVNKGTGSTLEILSSDAPTSYGLTPDFIVCDEITHWPSDELWVSLFSASAKRSACVLVIISNAGTGQGSSWQWKLREAARTGDAWYFHSLDGPQASWIAGQHLAEQRRLLPAIAFDRLWLNRWTSGSGDALTEADILAAVNRKLLPITRPKAGWVYVGGLDLGVRRDYSALVVVGKQVGETRVVLRKRKLRYPYNILAESDPMALLEDEFDILEGEEERVQRVRATGRLRLACLKVWKPRANGRKKIDLDNVERFVRKVHSRIGLAALAIDPWQAEHLAQRAERADVPVELIPPTPSNLQGMATAMLEAFNDRQIELFKDALLLADLRALRVEEKSYGVRLTSPRGKTGHGDTATALGLSLLRLKKETEPLGDFIASGPAVY